MSQAPRCSTATTATAPAWWELWHTALLCRCFFIYIRRFFTLKCFNICYISETIWRIQIIHEELKPKKPVWSDLNVGTLLLKPSLLNMDMIVNDCFVTRSSFPLHLVLLLSAGDCEHGPIRDALHVSSLRRQRHSHLLTLSLLPRHRTDQTEKDCYGSCACW